MKRSVSPYGRGMVVASTLVMIGFYGTYFSFSVFLKPIFEEFVWTRAMTSGAMSTSVGMSGLATVIAGRLADKYGTRVLVVIGAFVVASGYLLMSQTSSLWQLYLYFGVIVGTGMAACWTPINMAISRGFVEKKVLALGIATSGVAIGHMILPPLAVFLITAYEWRLAYIMLAIILLLFIISAIMLPGRITPQAIGSRDSIQQGKDSVSHEFRKPTQPSEWSATEAAKTVPFWMLMFTGFAISACFFFVIVHIVAYATDLGITPTLAALILTTMGGAGILGRLVVASIATRIGSRYTLLILLVLQALALFLLTQVTSLWALFSLGALFGFGSGATSPVRTSMISEFFGLRSVGTLIGIVDVSWRVGGIAGPVLAGYIFDLSQSYNTAFLAGLLLMIISMVATFFLRDPKG